MFNQCLVLLQVQINYGIVQIFWTEKKMIVHYIILLFDSCPKTFGSDQNHFGSAEGQGISVVRVKAVTK